MLGSNLIMTCLKDLIVITRYQIQLIYGMISFNMQVILFTSSLLLGINISI